MKQSELLAKVRSSLTDDEKVVFDKAKSNVDDFFSQMVDSSEEKLKGNPSTKSDSSVIDGFAEIHRLANEHGINFPMVKTLDEAKLYVSVYALELLKGSK